MPAMSTLMRFRGPSGSNAISPNPFKIRTAHFERGSDTDIMGIFKTPSQRDAMFFDGWPHHSTTWNVKLI
jgi:hypothetical protein